MTELGILGTDYYCLLGLYRSVGDAVLKILGLVNLLSANSNAVPIPKSHQRLSVVAQAQHRYKAQL